MEESISCSSSMCDIDDSFRNRTRAKRGLELVQNRVPGKVLYMYQSELLTRKQAAEYLGVAEQTLAVWKCTKRYPLPVVKIGRLVRYKKSDLDAFISNSTLHTQQR